MSKDKLPTIREDYDPNEWGNLGNDERLLDPKLNYKIAAKDRMKNPQTRAKISDASKKQHTKEFRKQASKRRLAQLDKPIDDSGITLREKLTEANRKSAANPIHHANRTAANRRLRNDPKWQKNHKKACQESYGYTIVTPIGEFPACVEFAKHVNQYSNWGIHVLKRYPHIIYKKEDGPGEEVYERIYHTPYGKCASVDYAYELAKQNNEPNAIKLKNIENWFIKMCRHNKEYFISFDVAKCWHIEKDYPYGALDINLALIKKDKLQQKIDIWNRRVYNTN